MRGGSGEHSREGGQGAEGGRAGLMVSAQGVDRIGLMFAWQRD